jgi:hypothetical protein
MPKRISYFPGGKNSFLLRLPHLPPLLRVFSPLMKKLFSSPLPLLPPLLRFSALFFSLLLPSSRRWQAGVCHVILIIDGHGK